ncbi:MAG: DUF5063 domain-containing protein [Salinivirgaceae bacterium]|nr:DUF5063 domain-containing protein [Salinivirgaceae bacterium]
MSASDNYEKTIYSDEVVAFTTLAAEYCKFLNASASFSQKDFVDRALKLLAILYVKTLSLPAVEATDADMIEKSVTQEEWDEVHNAVARKLGRFDQYTETLDPLAGDDAMTSLSEGFADIYQDLKDYVMLMQMGSAEMMIDAIGECSRNFREYWGQRLTNILRVLHHLQYSGAKLNTTDAIIAKQEDDRPSWERNGQTPNDNYWDE